MRFGDFEERIHSAEFLGCSYISTHRMEAEINPCSIQLASSTTSSP
jgi:hypothetical protein